VKKKCKKKDIEVAQHTVEVEVWKENEAAERNISVELDPCFRPSFFFDSFFSFFLLFSLSHNTTQHNPPE
jgi:hypothetical protein